MDKYYKLGGWEKLPGEVGRNGIDGLYIKRSNKGKIIDVLIAESKYNKSQLGNTLCGKQMSKSWILCKIDDLIKKEKDPKQRKEYQEIRKFIENDVYRAELCNLSMENNKIIITKKKIHQKGNTNVKIETIETKKIDLYDPKNHFEQEIVNSFKYNLEILPKTVGSL
ncbi:MAG: hypothetical protein ABGX27_01710 [Desulfurobacteriaceae bacterium]